MSQNLVKLFQQAINKKLRLKRTGKVWQLKETPLITMEAPNRYSLGFSLDGKSSPFVSLFGNNSPLDIAKICDAIIVLSYKNRAFIFVIEQKTRNKGYYKKQLANGKYFCDWLLALLKEHGHYDEEVTFILLLCWQPRKKLLRKGGMRHININKKPSKKLGPYQWLFEVENEEHIRLSKFIK